MELSLTPITFSRLGVSVNAIATPRLSMDDPGHISNVLVIRYTKRLLIAPPSSSSSSSSAESFSGYGQLQGPELTVGIGSSLDRNASGANSDNWFISVYHNAKSRKPEKLLRQLSTTQRSTMREILEKPLTHRKPFITELIQTLSQESQAPDDGTQARTATTPKPRFIELTEQEIYEIEDDKTMDAKYIDLEDLDDYDQPARKSRFRWPFGKKRKDENEEAGPSTGHGTTRS